MTTRQPLLPLSPPSANFIDTRYVSANGKFAMEEQEDIESVSGLSSLENDADEFEKLMIQNARDERRLHEARHGRVQAFRKARIHPRVDLTINNLERNNARSDPEASAHVKFESPPSSNGSARSDPAIHAPPGWGRKSRSNRNWMKTITYAEEEQQQLTPVATDDAINGRYNEPYEEFGDDAHNANIPRRSVEDSPLSHKGSVLGTPRNDRSGEWDLTFELNEASMIASTPYIPRNTALDDIRQREMESLREQQVSSAHLARAQEGPPEQTRRPRSSSAKSIHNVPNGIPGPEQAIQSVASPQKQLRSRTNSWKSIGKSQPVTSTGNEVSPVTMYKSAENIAAVDRDIRVTAQNIPPKRIPHRREDSQDLLRRLARVSNTPSPGPVTASRPHTAPEKKPGSLSPSVVTNTEPDKREGYKEQPDPQVIAESDAQALDVQGPSEASESDPKPVRIHEEEVEDVDATPMPVERSILNPKTPIVTGAWIDTPGPRTTRRDVTLPRSRSRSPKKSSPRKSTSPMKQPATVAKVALHNAAAEVLRPQLPSSALQSLVREAKVHDRRQSTDYGDSTINSLEDLIFPLPENAEGVDEDTLQGLQLPTSTPRNEAERQRQQELLHLHRMNDRLRAARTSIRDASRGMKRVEDRVEHADDDAIGEQVVHSKCSCTADGHSFSLWSWSRSFVWQARIKSLRQTSNSWWKVWGGMTGFSIFMTLLFTWWISEEIAWYVILFPLSTLSALSLTSEQ